MPKLVGASLEIFGVMWLMKRAFLAAAILAVPCAASADGKAQPSAPPCGWRGGALADPAATRACLEYRFKAPKPKTASSAPPLLPAPPAQPPSDAVSGRPS